MKKDLWGRAVAADDAADVMSRYQQGSLELNKVRDATPEELAKKLRMPLDKVRKVLKISKEPVSLE